MIDNISCPECGKQLRLLAQHRGKNVRCPSCGTCFQSPVPLLESAADPTEPRQLLPAVPPPVPQEKAIVRGAELLPDEPEPMPLPRPRRSTLRPPGSRSRRSPRSSTRGWLIVLAVTSGLVAIAAVGYFVVTPKEPARKPVAAQETDEERRQQVIAAFREEKPLEPDAIARELTPLFDDLGDAFQQKDGARIAAHFDMDRLFDELLALDVLPSRLGRNRADSVRSMTTGLQNSMRGLAPLLAWEHTEIRNVKKLQGNEAVVIARHRAADQGNVNKIRWWVSKRSGSWKIFDFEDLTVGQRASTGIAAASNLQADRLREMAEGVKHLRAALVALAQRDPDSAERELARIPRGKLPATQEALRTMAHGLVYFQRDQFQDALNSFELAHRLNPDMPLLDFNRGAALNRLGQWDKAEKLLRAYLALLGEDAETCRELGLSLRGLGRFPEAAVFYRKALDHNPNDVEALQGLIWSLEAKDKKDELGPRFARCKNHHETFDLLAAQCKTSGYWDSLEELIKAMRAIDPAHPPVDHYRGWVLLLNGRPAEAIPLFQAAIKREKDPEKRKGYYPDLLRAQAAIGKTLEAYNKAPDARQAFQFLAAELKKSASQSLLRQLIVLHSRKHEADPLLHLYRGELQVQEGRYRLADASFRAGAVKEVDDETLALFRSSRVLARYHIGQALSAHAEIGPRKETFEQLAHLCLYDENYPQLESVLDAHARTDPADLALPRFRYRLKLHQKQIPEGVALFKLVLDKQPAEKRQQVINEFLGEMIQLGKLVEGYQAAPDAQAAFRYLVEDYLEEGGGSVESFRALLEAHRVHYPDDSWLALATGQLHLREKAWNKAAPILKEEWSKAPKDLRERFRYPYVTALLEMGQVQQAYREVEPRADTFRQLANNLQWRKKWADLEALLKLHRKTAGESPELHFFEARTQIGLKHPAEAIPLFRKACESQPDMGQRRYYINTFVYEMESAGQGPEAYRAAPDRTAAFETLARQFNTRQKDKELQALLAEHTKDHPNDPLLQFYTAELQLRRGDPKAEQSFAAGLAKAATQHQWMYKNGLLRAQVKSGKAVAAYQEAASGPGTFAEVANLCLSNRDGKQLEALIAAHRQTDPDDPDLVIWELDLKWLQRDYEGALKLLADHRESVFAMPRHRWKYNDRQVRCLTKLKKTKEAIQQAEAINKSRQANIILLVLAHAAQGDVKQTIAVVEGLQRSEYLLESLYHDEDLGPLLQSEAFRSFRERFPPPKTEDLER